MIGTRLGEYDIVARLGAGAMGTVWLGQSDDGSRAALKVLHPHLVEEPGFFRRFEREAAVGLSVDHDNVVRVLDYEMFVVDGKPTCCVVMEYVEGRTLRQLLADLGQVPEALLREIALQIAQGLAAIHEQGVVHRDIKPDNVLITDDHRVRIMDLGVAKVLDASMELTQRGAFAGTLAYAAPEQLRGEDVTPSCDLYALGVTLYELATGDNPFQRDDAAAAIAAHVGVVPPRISESAEGVSPFLSEVAATLLAKKPAERLPSAADVAALFTDLESSEWWRKRESGAARVVHLRTLVPVRRQTTLQGRESELGVLRAALDAAREGRGRAILVTGEAGIGKSRLIDELIRELDPDALRVLYGSYSPSGGVGALAAATIDVLGREGLEARLRELLANGVGLAPAFGAHLRQEPPSASMQPLSAEALHTAFCRLAQGLARDRPTIWVIEDLHFASEDARKLVLSLARAVAGHRILLVVTTRPGLSDSEREQFTRMEDLTPIELSRLSPREVVALLRDAFRSRRLADKLGAKVAYKSDGVPFFVFEMIRGLREGQFITQLPDGTYVESRVIDDIEVPSAVRDLVAVRLTDLSDEDRAMLDLAAVNGYAFDPALIAQAKGLPRLHVLERIVAIERRHGVVRSDGVVHRFDHHLIQELLYEGLPELLKREYHSAIASVIEHMSTSDVLLGAPAVQACDHHLRGAVPTRALDHLRAALDALAAESSFWKAADVAARALAIPDGLRGVRRGEVLRRHAMSLNVLGRRDEERDALSEALSIAIDVGDRRLEADVRHRIGWLGYVTADYADAEREIAAACDLVHQLGDAAREAHTLGDLGNVLSDIGRADEAIELMTRAVDLARQCGDDARAATVLGALAIRHRKRGEFERAMELHAVQRESARSAGNVVGEASAAGGLGIVLQDLGRRSDAEEQFRRHRELSRSVGYRRGESAALGNLGTLFLDQGRIGDAIDVLEESLEIDRELSNRRGLSTNIGNLGNAYQLLGAFERARELHGQHLSLAREIGFRAGQAIAHHNLGNACRSLGRPDEARANMTAALAIARDISYRSLAAACLLELGRDHVVREEPTEAVACLEESLRVAEDTGIPEYQLLATYELAYLGALTAGELLTVFEAVRENVTAEAQRQARLALWKLTHDAAHLEAAYRVTCSVLDLAPDGHEAAIEERDLVTREILESWGELHAER